MTPKEKAFQLVNEIQVEHNKEERYYTFHMSLESAKRAALIAVDEAVEYEKRIIKEVQFLSDIAGHAFRCEGLYWEQVKQEIEKL